MPREVGSDPSGRGFTLLELMVVVVVVALTLAIGAQGYGVYLSRTAAQRTAQTFARDLTLARSAAVRARKPIVMRVDELEREYVVVTSDGEELLRREYGSRAEVRLDALDLRLPGDSLAFDGRGVADLSGAGGSLGSALFEVGEMRYEVFFNSMGASRIDAS